MGLFPHLPLGTPTQTPPDPTAQPLWDLPKPQSPSNPYGAFLWGLPLPMETPNVDPPAQTPKPPSIPRRFPTQPPIPYRISPWTPNPPSSYGTFRETPNLTAPKLPQPHNPVPPTPLWPQTSPPPPNPMGHFDGVPHPPQDLHGIP